MPNPEITERHLKITFIALALFMLLSMLMISRDAGISGDEEVHYKHSEMVYNYFATGGKDKSALDTPKTHLQYYGQAFDNLTTALIHWFGVDDIYGFRHLMSSISGWLTILVTAVFAAWIAGYGAAILVLLLFTASPNFLGHSQNNLKDIPFALAYISSIFYSIKLIFTGGKPSWKTIILLIISIGFSIGIRIGGILVIFYLGLFFILKTLSDWTRNQQLDISKLKRQIFQILLISVTGYLLGIITWPYALQNPVMNPLKSYQVMTHFPTTVRQIFEGNFEWSDFQPWYYLPKYMTITIPLVVSAGLAAFLLRNWNNVNNQKVLIFVCVGITILFPMTFVILQKSNLYGSWRHFLFVYPGIILVSALGIHTFLQRFQQKLFRFSAVLILFVLMLHPIRFMAANHPYYYLYYNQLTGGLKGAYGQYETDYYFHTMRKGSEWLQKYTKEKGITEDIIVAGNFPSHWYFRKNNHSKFVYCPYPNRSEYDWDYMIVANSYIPPQQLKNKNWPPPNTIHEITADGVPVCAVIERITKDDLKGILELKNGDYVNSVLSLQNAQQLDSKNELICYKFAESLIKVGQVSDAHLQLEKCLEINQDNEKALVLKGDLALKEGDSRKAEHFYQRTISANRKYLSAYPKLAGIYSETDIAKSRKILRTCLKLDSKYKPALEALAESYRNTNPEISRKLDERINQLK